MTIFFEEHIFMMDFIMMYPLMTLDDNTEIVHSEMGKDGFSQKVEKGMDALWDSGKWNDEKNEEILKEHLRTPYKGNAP